MDLSPALSVILLIGDQRDRAQRALDSVLQQDCIDRIEVLPYVHPVLVR